MREWVEGLENSYQFSISGIEVKGVDNSGELSRDELITEHF